MCGVKNKSIQDIFKYGFKETGVNCLMVLGKLVRLHLENNYLSANTAKSLSLRNHQLLKI